MSRPGPAWTVHAALAAVQVAFASQSVEAKLAMLPRSAGGEAIAPECLAMVRMVAGALVFQGALRLARSRSRPRAPLTLRDHASLFGLSVLGISLNQALFLTGLRSTTPLAASLVGVTIPIFAAALAILFGKERRSVRTLLGIALALGGVVSLTGVASVDRGAVLVALNSLSYAAYVVLSRDVVVRLGSLTVMAWVFTYGGVAFAPLGFEAAATGILNLTARGYWLVGYIVAVPTVLAYLLNAWALARSSATLVTVYIYVQPLIAALLSWIQLGVAVTPRAGVAAVLIFAGVAVVASRQGRPRAPSDPTSPVQRPPAARSNGGSGSDS